VIPESCREIPFEDNMLMFIGEFAGEAAKICPRNLLKRDSYTEPATQRQEQNLFLT
jgi:hypothetical protein